MKTLDERLVGKQDAPEQHCKQIIAQIINNQNVNGISLKPSQALCMHVLKKNIGKYISTYTFRAEGVSHPAGRIQELTEKGILIDRFYGSAFDEHGIEHTRAGWYRLVVGGA